MNIHAKPSVTTGPLPASRKVHTSPEGFEALKVPFREIELHPSAKEPPVRVYDTSGPYTDPQALIDVEAGLPRLREAWIEARGDSEIYEGREVRPEDNGNVGGSHLARAFPVRHAPRRGRPGRPLTQMDYARAGIVTAEMAYIAERENIGRKRALANAAHKLAEGESFGADIPEFITPEFVRREVAEGRAIIPANINHPEVEPMIIGRNFLVKINANIAFGGCLVGRGRSDKMVWRSLGRDTVMDLPRAQYPQHARMDHPKFAGADRHGADLSGARKGRWHRGKSDLGGFPRHADRAGRAGVDYFTIHAGVRLAYVPLTAKRVTGIVSRGGSIMAKWCLAHHKESFLYEHFDEICDNRPRL